MRPTLVLVLVLVAAAAFITGVMAAGGMTSAAGTTMFVGVVAGGIVGIVVGRMFNGRADPPASRPDIDGWGQVSRELERSRRHERPFAILRLAAPPDLAELAGAWCSDLAARLAPSLRQLDTVWTSDEAVLVLMPECDRTRATQTLARIIRAIPEPPLAGMASLASFPEDAVTGLGLREALEASISHRLEHLPTPVTSARTDGG